MRAEASLISRGTERLIWSGLVPESEHERMRGPNMAGAFPFPVKYGYALAGTVEAGPADLLGRTVSRFICIKLVSLPVAELVLAPPSLSPARAALAANLETALNALWDAGAGPGDRIAVIGAGLIGCRSRASRPACPELPLPSRIN